MNSLEREWWSQRERLSHTLSVAEHSQRTSYATGKLLTEFFIKDAVDAGKIKSVSILAFANVYSKDERVSKAYYSLLFF